MTGLFAKGCRVSFSEIDATNQRNVSAERHCILKRLVPLPRLAPAACCGVNKPFFCASACFPEGRKPELQLGVLIKVFRGDYHRFAKVSYRGSDWKAFEL